MPSLPRIYRSSPSGSITTAAALIPVLVTLRWKTTLEPTEVLAQAVAWTRTEVEVEWVFQGETRRDWVQATDVRRHGTRPRPSNPAPGAARQLPQVDTRHPRRW
jgi:hypothetical protein